MYVYIAGPLAGFLHSLWELKVNQLSTVPCNSTFVGSYESMVLVKSGGLALALTALVSRQHKALLHEFPISVEV